MPPAHPSKLATSSKNVFGFDIGSTKLVVAFQKAGETRVQDVMTWLGQDSSSHNNSGVSVPSAIYLASTSPIDLQWGRKAEMEQKEKGFDRSRYFSSWKPGLEEGSPYFEQFKAFVDRFGLRVGDIAYEFMIMVLKYMFFDKGAFFRDMDIANTMLVIAKPPAWNPKSYKPFKDAALKLGFKPQNILFASEPECGFRAFLVRKATEPFHLDSFQAGNELIILDLGGGTMDLERYMLNVYESGKPARTRIKQVGPLPMSEMLGAETMVFIFERLLQGVLESAKQYTPGDIAKIVQTAGYKFGKAKRFISIADFRNLTEFKTFDIRNICRGEGQDGLGFGEGELLVDIALFKQLLDELIDSIIRKIDEFLACSPSLPQVMVIVGGFSSFWYTKHRLENHYEPSGLRMEFVPNPIPLVARGAVDIGVNDKVVTTRRLTQHYALLTRFELTLAVKELYPNTNFEVKVDEVDGRSYFLVYEWLAKAGFSIHNGQSVTVDLQQMRRRDVALARQRRKGNNPVEPWQDRLSWRETICIIDGAVNLGDEKWTSISDSRLQADAEYIILAIDLNGIFCTLGGIPTRSVKKGGRARRVHCIEYGISLKARSESVEYWLTVCTKFTPLETMDIQIFPVEDGDKMSIESFSEAGSYPVLPGPGEDLQPDDDSGMSDPDLDSDDIEEEDIGAIIAEKQPIAKSRMQQTTDLHSSTTPEGSPTASYQLMSEVLERAKEARLKMALETSEELSILDQPYLAIPTSPPPPGLTAKPRRRANTKLLSPYFGTPTVQKTEIGPDIETRRGSLSRDKITILPDSSRPRAPKLTPTKANSRRTSKRVVANLKRGFKPISEATGKENAIGSLSLADGEETIIVERGGKEAGTLTRSMAIKVGKLDGGDMKRVRFR